MALIDKLLACWELEASGGDVHTGTYQLTNGISPSFVAGKVGNCGDFELGSTNSLRRPSDDAALSISPTTGMTFAAWFKAESSSFNADILGKGDNDDQEYALTFIQASSVMRMRIDTATGFSGTIFADVSWTPDTNWHFVVGWWDPADSKCYVQLDNGTPQASSGTGTPYDSNAVFGIGAANTSFPSYYDGLIDQVMAFDEVLTSQDRTDLYNGGNGLSYAALSGGGGGVSFFTTFGNPARTRAGRKPKDTRKRRAA